MREPETIFEDKNLRIMLAQSNERSNGRTLVSFTGVGHGMGGIDVQKPEFFKAGDGYGNMVFVTDVSRSWGNRIDFAFLNEVLEPFKGKDGFDALGNSMGGFLAVLAARFLQFRTVVAFAPQFSVKPEIVPWETRWRNYRQAIEVWRYPSLDEMWLPETRYYVFSSVGGLDGKHTDMLPERENLTVTKVKAHHDFAQTLKDAGLLHEVIRACFEQSYSTSWFNEALAASGHGHLTQ
ncbi:MAG: hypothetical protein IH625_09920 [Rhodobacteraceae bacterium]|nr:hypothetical protein [Paracoccaceae bacterium]